MFLGIDIGGTRIKAGVVTDQGQIKAQRETATPLNMDDFVRDLQKLVRLLVEVEGPPAATGIGCKGIVDVKTTRVAILPGALQFLEGHHLSDFIASELGTDAKIVADNDARVAMMGELLWGAAQSCEEALMLTLGSGVGGAVVTGGKLIRGSRGVAGHFGHLTVSIDGPRCVCGNRGCLETIFSALAIEGEARAAIHRGCESVLSEQFRGNLDVLTCRDVFKAASLGDPTASSIVETAIRFLAGAVAGLAHAFDPETIVLGGQITEAGAQLFEPLRRQVWQRSSRLLGRKVPIVPTEISDKSGIVGGAALALGILQGRA